MQLGELSALGAAFLWSFNGLLLRPITRTLPALRITALQYPVVAVLFWCASVATGKVDAVFGLSGDRVLALSVTAIFGLAAGDTAYVRSLTHLGLARSYTLSTAGYFVIVVALGALVLGEPASFRQGLGAAVMLVGIWFVARTTEVATAPSKGAGASPSSTFVVFSVREGLTFAGIAALCWGLNTVALRILLEGIEVLTANTVRLTAASLALGLAALLRYGPRTVAYQGPTAAKVMGAGLLGLGLGSILFLQAIQLAGVAKTAILSSTSPLFAAVLAVVFLGERVTFPLALGTLLTVAGMILVS